MFKVSKFSIITCIFVLLLISISLSLSSTDVLKLIGSTKYILLVIFSLFFIWSSVSFKVDSISAFGFLAFLFFVLFFTLMNSPDIYSIVSASGYFFLFIIWLGAQSQFSLAWLMRFSNRALIYIALAHIFISFVYLFLPGSFTEVKGQFKAYFHNPNAYAGITGFLLVLTISNLRNKDNLLFYVYLIVVTLLGIFTILAGSRSVLMCAFVSFLLTNNKIYLKFATVVFGLLTAFLIYVGNILSSILGMKVLNRDVLEDTGRSRIALSYIETLKDNYFVLGSGLSEQGGRIKTELAYIDAWQFSGIGFFGLVLFIAIGLYKAYKLKSVDYPYIFPGMVYVATTSFFEGYISNVMSALTIMFYIFHGIASYIYNKRPPFKQIA